MSPMADRLHYPRDAYFPKRPRPVHWDVFCPNACISLDCMWQGSLEELFNLGRPRRHAARKNSDHSVFLPHLPRAVIVQLGKVRLRKHTCLDFMRLLRRDMWALRLSVGLIVRVKFGHQGHRKQYLALCVGLLWFQIHLLTAKTKESFFSELKSFRYENEVRHVTVSPYILVSLRSTQQLSCWGSPTRVYG